MPDFLKLGTLGTTLRDYQLLEYSQYNAQLANPFAAQIDTRSEYGELESYSQWSVDDWQAGVGQRRPENGGSLFAHIDSRFPNQMILPMGWEFPYDELGPSSGSDYAEGDLTIDGTVITKASTSFRIFSTQHDLMAVWIYCDAEDGTTITVDIYDTNKYLPSESVLGVVGTGTVTKYRPGPVWVRVLMDATTLTAWTRYHVIVSADASLTLPKIIPAGTLVGCTYDGSTWTQIESGFMFITGMVSTQNNLGLENHRSGDSLLMEDGNEFLLIAGDDQVEWMTKAGERYFVAYNNRMSELNNDGTITLLVTTTGPLISDLISFGDQVVICYGTGYKIFNLEDDSTDTYTDDVSLMGVWNYYLWRAYENDLYYSGDGETWTQVEDPIGPDDYEIRGMAGLEDVLYLSTDYGLYALMPGNYVRPLKNWPTTDSRNGRGMVEWNGALYIPLAEDLMRYGPDGSMTQIGLRTGEELPFDIQGVIHSLQPTNYFLLASIQPSDPDGYGSLWAYNEQGWHCIGLMPQGVAGGGIYLDTSTNPGKLWWGGDYGLLAQAKYPSSVINPIRDRGEKLFARHGWVEQDRFYGGHFTLDKDFDGVYIDTEDMTSSTISIYWKDQDSTDWELLGSSTDDDFEERWSIDDGTRPNTKWLKLGLLFRTDDEQYTPIVRGHAVKFHTMIADRWRWNIVLSVHGNETQTQEMSDGTMQEYTGEQMKTHIEGLIQQVPPFVMEDIDGVQYEAKIIQAGRSIQRAEFVGGELSYMYLYSLILDQVTSGTYN